MNGYVSQEEIDSVADAIVSPSKTMKQMALEFSHAFGRPVNDSVVPLTVTERELLGKLIFEECVEYVTLGLGLKIVTNVDNLNVQSDGQAVVAHHSFDSLTLELDEGVPYDPIESADGLGDMNVLVHFNSLWHGFDIDAVTHEIFLSNMSKLDGMGKPIINGLTEGYRKSDVDSEGVFWCDIRDPDEPGYDSTKPMGKILKGPNYFPPNIAKVIGVE